MLQEGRSPNPSAALPLLTRPQFAVNLLYQGTPSAKPKLDIVVDSKAGDTKAMLAAFEAIQQRLTELATEFIPSQSTNAFWKNKPDVVLMSMPKLLKEGKEFSKDGVSGRYDPSLTLSLKVPSEKDLFAETEEGQRLRAEIAAYEPPAGDRISKGYNDTPEAYIAALRKLPPFTWGVTVKLPSGKRDAEGNVQLKTTSNDVLLEKRTLTGYFMFELSSLMIKPVRTISIQMRLRQVMLCDTAASSRRVEDADLDALWKVPASAGAAAADAPAADADADDEDF